MDLPSRMCVIGGQVLRIGIGIEDRQTEERWTFPIRNSVWRMTRSSGFWEQWDARQSNGFGPFRFGDEEESVYMWIPFDIGHWGKLEAMVPGYRADLITLVDNYWNEPGRCEWPDEGVYVSGSRPEPTPTPVPTPTPTPTPDLTSDLKQ